MPQPKRPPFSAVKTADEIAEDLLDEAQKLIRIARILKGLE